MHKIYIETTSNHNALYMTILENMPHLLNSHVD